MGPTIALGIAGNTSLWGRNRGSGRPIHFVFRGRTFARRQGRNSARPRAPTRPPHLTQDATAFPFVFFGDIPHNNKSCHETRLLDWTKSLLATRSSSSAQILAAVAGDSVRDPAQAKRSEAARTSVDLSATSSRSARGAAPGPLHKSRSTEWNG